MFLQIRLPITPTCRPQRAPPLCVRDRRPRAHLGQFDPDGKDADGEDDPGHLERDLVDLFIVLFVPASPRVGVEQVDRIGSCDKRSIVMFGRSADKQKNEGRRPKDQSHTPRVQLQRLCMDSPIAIPTTVEMTASPTYNRSLMKREKSPNF